MGVSAWLETLLADGCQHTRSQASFSQPRCFGTLFIGIIQFLFLLRHWKDPVMSASRMFSVIGDANVTRNMTGLNMASREVMGNSQVLQCSSMATIDQALNDVRPESEALIVACITEFLLCGGDSGTIYSTIDPVLAAFSTKMKGFCAFRPQLQVR